MSLHNLAKHVQSSGRGQDTQLVHMSHREVQGLQALAKAKGGSLSINPNTGLPEAGFLEDILPVVAGAAATYFTAGAAAPMLTSAFGATAGGILAGAGAGALVGGGMSAIQGGDVGRGVLTGGLGGALMGGMSNFGTAGLENAGSSMVPTANEIATQGVSAQAANAPVQMANSLQSASAISPTTGAMLDPTAGGYGISPQAGIGIQAPAPGAAIPQGVGISPGAAPTPVAAAPVSPYTPVGVTGATPPASSSGITGMWNELSPLQKAGVSLTGAGLVAGVTGHPNTTTAPTEDYESPLKRISPNFRAQAPIQPNPYYRAQYPVYAAEGGIVALAQGGSPVEQMSQNMLGGIGNMYPQSQQEHTNFATPTQMPASAEVVRSDYDAKTDPYTGVMMASGGLSSLGGYSDGGQLLKGPGDGVSDSIPASIGQKQPARLADGEFVVPARIVSELGNGSTDAGARKLYAMMDRVQSARKKSIGKGKVAANTKADKLLPA